MCWHDTMGVSPCLRLPSFIHHYLPPATPLSGVWSPLRVPNRAVTTCLTQASRSVATKREVHCECVYCVVCGIAVNISLSIQIRIRSYSMDKCALCMHSAQLHSAESRCLINWHVQVRLDIQGGRFVLSRSSPFKIALKLHYLVW